MAFFSRKPSVAESNYDVSIKELLSIKAALEEWRHWLEGAHFPFRVITDHKNLEYIKNAKRLNPCQACQALFFTQFTFTVTYCPDSKNSKADALSRMCDSTNTLLVPEPILPPSVIVALIRWDIMEEIQCALQDEPHSLHCPNNKQYVPQKLMQRVMQWVHTSLSTGHPGITRTCALVCNSFWWPTLNDDVAAYVRSSHICAHQGHQDKVRQAC